MADVGKAIHGELSGERAQMITAAITQFHRPPGAAGYHAATNLVIERLREAGIEHVQIETYPLDGETVFGEGPMPFAWEPYGANISVVSPVGFEVTDMERVSSCLAWWSKPTAEGGITAELVDVGTGESEDDFAGKEIQGRIVLIGHTERPGGWTHAATLAMQHGAAGIISDYLFYSFVPHRTREGLPDAVQLLRLPNQQGRYDAWACSIEYPVAQRLRELLKIGPVMLHADIRCRLFAGHGQNVVATIDGDELPDEAVYFVAHTSAATCPCANCAAGPALMVEIARTLNDLIARGEIARPRRSIKFLFIIEGLGSRAYIDGHPEVLTSTRAAFCFDSVGHDQAKLKSSLLFYRHPDAFPSFINDYFAGVMERAPNDGTWVFANDSDIPTVRFFQAPYTPWSDNHIWAAYGIPSPLIMSWPDLYFHTQLLTADQTDPAVFRRTGITTALAAYEIADAGALEALTMAEEVAARSILRLETTANDAVRRMLANGRPDDNGERVRKQLAYFSERDAQAVLSVLALVDGRLGSEAQARIDERATAVLAQAGKSIARVEGVMEMLAKERAR
jgi:hypothetical protein